MVFRSLRFTGAEDKKDVEDVFFVDRNMAHSPRVLVSRIDWPSFQTSVGEETGPRWRGPSLRKSHQKPEPRALDDKLVIDRVEGAQAVHC